MRASLSLLLAGALVLASCDEPTNACPSAPPETCTPAYEPTFANVFSKTLAPSCAKSGVSCHAEGAQGGLSFLAADRAHADLLSTRAVVPSGVACSSIVTRLEATDGKVRMPPGRSLDAGEVCAVRRWIASGAPR